MNRGRMLAMLWLLVVVAVLLGSLHVMVRARHADALTSQLHRGEGSDLTRSAVDLLQMELRRAQPRPNVVVQAWGTLRGQPQAGIARAMLEARIEQDLARMVQRSSPDEVHLHRLWELAAIIDAELAVAVHVRIAARAGERGAAAAHLAEVAATLRSEPVLTDPAVLIDAWQQLREAGTGPSWFTWAARETPPMARAVTDAERAVAQALSMRLDAAEEGVDPRPVWQAAQAMRLTDRLPDPLVARYAEHVRITELPTVALIVCAALATALFGALAFAFHRLGRGRRRIDPGAETLENVEPIELETDAITVQRQVTSEETRVD